MAKFPTRADWGASLKSSSQPKETKRSQFWRPILRTLLLLELLTRKTPQSECQRRRAKQVTRSQRPPRNQKLRKRRLMNLYRRRVRLELARITLRRRAFRRKSRAYRFTVRQSQPKRKTSKLYSKSKLTWKSSRLSSWRMNSEWCSLTKSKSSRRLTTKPIRKSGSTPRSR